MGQQKNTECILPKMVLVPEDTGCALVERPSGVESKYDERGTVLVQCNSIQTTLAKTLNHIRTSESCHTLTLKP